MKSKIFNLSKGYWSQTGFGLIWYTGLLLLPITSLPILTKIGQGITVAPPSVVLMLGLALGWTLPSILIIKKIPQEVKVFGVFLIIAGISWAFSFFLPILPYRDHLIATDFPEAFLTLALATSVYVASASWVSQNPDKIQRTIQIINISGFILILWSMTQSYFVLFEEGIYPKIILHMQDLISSRSGELLFADRITGLAYEPSWLAHQLVMVYIPLWLAASLERYTAFPRRIGFLSVENILLAGGIFTLFMSFSRIGWLSFLLIVAFVAYEYHKLLVQVLTSKLAHRFGAVPQKFLHTITTFSVLIVLGFVYISIIAGLIWLGSRLELRLAKILIGNFNNISSFLELTNRLFFAERAVYWSAGWEVFGRYPWLGVGLGNVGYFFPQTMPAFGYGLTEIQNLFYRFTFLPNTKSMWIRLFSETGIIGISFFITWLLLCFHSMRVARKYGDASLKVVGWMGQFVLVAFLTEGFNQDSFAMPYFWFSLGLSSAVAALTRQKLKKEYPDL